MAVTTTQLREWWAPACTGPWASMYLNGSGHISVRPAIVNAVKALNNCLVHYKYATRAADTGAYNCRKITGGTGYSLHAYGIAIDINWTTNPYGPVLKTDMPKAMTDAIQHIRTKNGKQVWRWGGTYSTNKDAMHFEIFCSPADLATGIDPTTVAGYVKPVVRVGFAPGDTGAGVKFLEHCLNILHGVRINSKGVSGGIIIREDGIYDAQTTEAVKELQRFGNAMAKLSGGTLSAVDGIADKDVLDLISFWVPIVQK